MNERVNETLKRHETINKREVDSMKQNPKACGEQDQRNENER